jgi:hypothetical protein
VAVMHADALGTNPGVVETDCVGVTVPEVLNEKEDEED